MSKTFSHANQRKFFCRQTPCSKPPRNPGNGHLFMQTWTIHWRRPILGTLPGGFHYPLETAIDDSTFQLWPWSCCDREMVLPWEIASFSKCHRFSLSLSLSRNALDGVTIDLTILSLWFLRSCICQSAEIKIRLPQISGWDPCRSNWWCSFMATYQGIGMSDSVWPLLKSSGPALCQSFVASLFCQGLVSRGWICLRRRTVVCMQWSHQARSFCWLGEMSFACSAKFRV